MKYKTHRCLIGKEIDDIKFDLTEVKAQLNQLRFAQEEIV